MFADQEYDLTNPDGIRFDLGHDFLETIMAPPEIAPQETAPPDTCG